jgi:hypothetical protein
MKKIMFLIAAPAALLLLAFSIPPGPNSRSEQSQPSNSLVQIVREATWLFEDVAEAGAAGYEMFLGCVSGPQTGAMGFHYPNPTLVGDGILNPAQPEVLIYEIKNGKHSLVAVEFLVLAEDWDAINASPPVLEGQLFHFNGSPNRYGLPPFYELHVWAWKHNPSGVFADWNPNVTCE